ncbi:hypothetical protein C2857_003891 [Epichloe festucae Fl1]|uniref:Uncharacterized protein n=1 Tax=Epichloe festucae (strain Fl1) TaxID=877507 RepID=A0A7U3SP51_EPIFF|nr:hypothetical protein C2857_003891 [Epichloe festucae Fl1]
MVQRTAHHRACPRMSAHVRAEQDEDGTDDQSGFPQSRHRDAKPSCQKHVPNGLKEVRMCSSACARLWRYWLRMSCLPRDETSGPGGLFSHFGPKRLTCLVLSRCKTVGPASLAETAMTASSKDVDDFA